MTELVIGLTDLSSPNSAAPAIEHDRASVVGCKPAGDRADSRTRQFHPHHLTTDHLVYIISVFAWSDTPRVPEAARCASSAQNPTVRRITTMPRSAYHLPGTPICAMEAIMAHLGVLWEQSAERPRAGRSFSEMVCAATSRRMVRPTEKDVSGHGLPRADFPAFPGLWGR